MTTCPCDLPGSERQIFLCVRLGCRMTPHFCHLYQTNDSYRNAWNEGRGPGQRLAVPRPKRTMKTSKPRKPCGRKSVDAYSDDDAKFALFLCIRCEHYDDDSDHCQAPTTCKRVARQLSRPCSERVKLPGHGCPLMRW